MSIEKIKAIEEYYPVEQIVYRNFQVWSLIRFPLWAYYMSRVEPIRTNTADFAPKRKIKLLFSSFYSFRDAFKKYHYLCFSDTSERKRINGLLVDKSVDFILQSLPKTLLIELPLPQHYQRSQIASPYVISKIPLYLLEWFFDKLFLRNLKIDQEEVIENILSELGIQFDYRNVLRKNIAQYHVGKLLTWLYRPKGIIIQCAYTNTGFVKAFKDSGIKVVEVQHGLLSTSHVAYNVFKNLDPSYFPDFFLSYGIRERNFFKNLGYYINEQNVIPVGHYYIDVINSSKKNVNDIIPEAARFDFTIAVTGQNLPDVEQKFIDFIKIVAHKRPTVCFLYIPRNSQSDIFRHKELPENLYIISDRDTYEVIRVSELHTTIYSTCAIEALALGTPNLLVDIDGLANEHYGNVLTESKTTRIVNTVDDYLAKISTKPLLNKNEVAALNKGLIQPNYRENIHNAIEMAFDGDKQRAG